MNLGEKVTPKKSGPTHVDPCAKQRWKRSMKVVGAIASANGLSLGYVVKAKRKDARPVLLRNATLNEPAALKLWLRENGWAMNLDIARELDVLLRRRNRDQITAIDRVGFSTVPSGDQIYASGGKVFAYPKSVVADQVFLIGDAAHPAVSRGDAADFINELSKILKRNDRLIAGICVALSCAFSRPLNFENSILILSGDSSLGKSTLQHIVAALWGAPTQASAHWNATLRGVERMIRDASDHPFCLHDYTRADKPTDVFDVIYSSGNCATRRTADTDQLGAKFVGGSLILSGESTLGDYARKHRVPLDRGVYARTVHLSPDGRYGMFDQLPDGLTGAQFSDRIRAFTETHYGTFWPQLLQQVSANWLEIVDDFHETFEATLRSLTASSEIFAHANPVTQRSTRQLAFAAFVGKWACKLGLLKLSYRDDVKPALAAVIAKHVKESELALERPADRTTRLLLDAISARSGDLRPWSQSAKFIDDDRIIGFTDPDFKGLNVVFVKTAGMRMLLSQITSHIDGALTEIGASGQLLTQKRGFLFQRKVRRADLEKSQQRDFYAVQLGGAT